MFFKCKTESDIDDLINKGLDINFQESKFGQTYLHTLVQSNSKLLPYFISKKPKTNIINMDGKTPIFYCKNIDTVNLLVECGANLLIKDSNGKEAKDVNPFVREWSMNLIKKYNSIRSFKV
jgi:ankyrin repeat protein